MILKHACSIHTVCDVLCSASGGFHQYAVKFFLHRDHFATEAALYAQKAIAAVMPPVVQACSNESERIRGCGDFVFPGFIVMERGVPLCRVRTTPRLFACKRPLEHTDLLETQSPQQKTPLRCLIACSSALKASAKNAMHGSEADSGVEQLPHVQWLQESRPVLAVLLMMRDLADRLDQLHSAQIVHRDLKVRRVSNLQHLLAAA